MLWKSKKHDIFSRLSVESEYRTVVDLTCELMWIQNVLI